MKDLIVINEYRSSDILKKEDKEKSFVKNECFLTRYLYEGIINTQGDSLVIVDDQHGNQKRRYYNSRRGV
jgi:hypothetical protein